MNYSRWAVRLLALVSLLSWYALPPGVGAANPAHAAELSNTIYAATGCFAGDGFIADDDTGQNDPHRTHARRPVTGKVKVKVYSCTLPPAAASAQAPANIVAGAITIPPTIHLPVPSYYSHLYRLALF